MQPWLGCNGPGFMTDDLAFFSSFFYVSASHDHTPHYFRLLFCSICRRVCFTTSLRGKKKGDKGYLKVIGHIFLRVWLPFFSAWFSNTLAHPGRQADLVVSTPSGPVIVVRFWISWRFRNTPVRKCGYISLNSTNSAARRRSQLDPLSPERYVFSLWLVSA